MKISRMFFIFSMCAIAVLALGTRASGQLLVENFSYTAGDTLHNVGGWTAHSGPGTNSPRVTSPGLSYSGYVQSGIGNAAGFTTNGEDVNKTFASYPNGRASGSLYYSVMAKLDSSAATGDYFFHLYKNSSTFTARIFAKRAANGNIRFGIGRSSAAANINYSDSIYTVGTTYLLVVKYTVIAGTTNDTVALWINPPTTGTEPTPTVFESAADRASTDIDTVYGVALRQGSAAAAPIGTVDGIRVDTVWSLSAVPTPLSGTYTVGVAGNYTTLSAAITALTTLGVSGAVNFLLTDASYTDSLLDVTPYTGASAANTVTIKPAASVNTTLNLKPNATVPAGIRIRGVKYFTIDGSNSGGSTRNMTVNVTDTTGTVQYAAILLTDTCSNITVKNAFVKGNRPTGTAVVVGAIRVDTVATRPSSSNIIFDNLNVSRAISGFAINGRVLPSGQMLQNLEIKNCFIGGAGTQAIAAQAMNIFGTNNAKVYNNEVNGINTGAFAFNCFGINFAGSTTNAQVYNNQIHNVTYAGASTGVAIAAQFVGLTGFQSRYKVYNNMVWDINAPTSTNTASGGGPLQGLSFPSCRFDSVYYNTVVISGTSTANNHSVAFYIVAPTAAETSKTVVVNNIFVNTSTMGTTASNPAVKYFDGSGASYSIANRNDYLTGGPRGAIAAVGALSLTPTFLTTLADFQTRTGMDANSISADPQFISASNVHIRTDIATPVESAGQIVAGITTDIDGNLRFGAPGYSGGGTAPDIGADEGTFIPAGPVHDIGVSSISAAAAFDSPSSVSMNVASTNELSRALAANQRVDAVANEREQIAHDESAYLSAAAQPAFASGTPVATAASSVNVTVIGDVAADAPANFRALVRNFGGFVEPTYQVGWTIDGAAQTAVNQPRALQIGAVDTVLLTWATPTAGAHVLRAFTILASDLNRANDTATYNFNVTPSDIVFEQGFNQTIPPYPTGWHVKNRDGGGTSTYFQGNPTVFPAFEGSGYIGANYNAANGLYIDEWLVTPNTGGLLANPNAAVDSLIFWQRDPGLPAYYPDSLQIRVSTTDTAVASFSLVLDYFRVDSGSWRRKAYVLPTGANRYIAFRYLHYNGGSGPNSNYIGIDAVQIKRTSGPTVGWTAQTSGITNQFWSVKAVSPTVAWAAAVGGRVLRTVDGGSTWTSVGGGRIGTADIYNITAVDANTAFVTTSAAATYIFRTTNGGVVWDTVFTQVGGFIDAIHMYDATNGVALGDPVPATLWTILRTTNGGASWARIATEPAAIGGEAGTQNDLTVSGPSNIWFGSSAGGRVYRSTNAGATWTSSTVPGAAATTRVISVWFNNANYGIAGHYTTSGVYNAARSTDGGTTWTAVTVGAATTYNVSVAGNGVDFWMGRGTNVFTSSDRGATWTQSYTGTGTFYDVDFVTSGSSTYGWGVKDNGNIVAYFGTITGVNEQHEQLPTSFSLAQNYPNPFNPSTTIRYALPEAAHVTLSIYNLLGQRVAELTNEVQSAGFYNTIWNSRNQAGAQVATGVYFYRIEATPAGGGAPFVSLKKMVLLK